MRVFCTIFRARRSSIVLCERLRSELAAPAPGQVALEPRKPECAGARTGMIEV
jgi:hypothetical protein